MSIVEPPLSSSFPQWLVKNGRPEPPPELTDTQEKEIAQAFKLLDADGGGSLDADELYQAFQALGFHPKRSDIARYSSWFYLIHKTPTIAFYAPCYSPPPTPTPHKHAHSLTTLLTWIRVCDAVYCITSTMTEVGRSSFPNSGP